MNKPTNTRTQTGAADTDHDQDKAGASSSLFDLRVLIAGLLLVYGVLLVGAGLFDNATTLSKADGVRINLWEGIALLAVACCFGIWRLVDRPK